jgi:hypothetical protein
VQLFKSHRRAVTIGSILMLVVAAAAYAYWTNTGSGTGSATTGTNNPVTVVQTSTVSGLYPGGPTQALSGTFNNPNPGKAYVASVTVALASITGSSGTPACTTADYQINNATATVNAEVDPGNGQGSWSGPSIQMLDSGTNQDACKNATVNLTYTSN